MKYLSKFFLITLLASGCSEKDEERKDTAEKFTSELIELKEFFKIPGLAVSIDEGEKNIYRNYLGFSDIEKQSKLDTPVAFPITLITKVFSGVLMMKLMEEEKDFARGAYQ